MSFLSNQKLRDILPDCIDPYVPKNLENAAYELCLGNEYFATNSVEGKKSFIKHGEQITIRPGQCSLLLTKETISIPNHLLAFISIKATFKFCGLVNVSGFHVDPRYSGKLMFAVYNAGSANVVLTEGQNLFPIWFCELTDELEKNEIYDGKSKNRKDITGEDVMKIHGEIYSPNVLHEMIKELENTKVKDLESSVSAKIKDLEKSVTEVNTKRTIYLTIAASVLLLAISVFVNTMLNSASYQAGQKQGQLETKVDSVESKTSSQANLITTLQKEITELQTKVDGPTSNANAQK